MTDRSPDEDFASMLQDSWSSSQSGGTRRLKRGQVVEGRVVEITKDMVFVDVNAKSEGRIERRQLERDGELKLKVGDRVRATVADPNGPDLVVSLGKASAEALSFAHESNTPVEGTVTEVIKGGLAVEVGGKRAFCPASQADGHYVSDLSVLVGQTLQFLVTEFRDGGRSIVLSRRALVERERAAQAESLLRDLRPEAELDGTVASVQAYGAFIELGGVQGLVHISELAHTRVARADEVVSVGEKVRVKVLTVEHPEDPKKTRVSLSIKALTQPTAEEAAGSAGEVVQGTVAKVEAFGIFVDTPGGQGMVPSRELDLPPGGDPRRAYPIGKTVEVVVQGKNDQTGRLRLSIRAVEETQARAAFAEFRSASKKSQKGGRGLGSLGDLMEGVDLGRLKG